MSHRCTILATAGHDHTIRLWELQTGECYRTIYYRDLVNKLEITPDMCKLAAACNPDILLFDVTTDNPYYPERIFKSHTNNVKAVGFNNDGNMMFSGSGDGCIKIWDLRAPAECQKEYKSVYPINSVVLHPNQTELISGDQNGNIRIWDLRANLSTGELVQETSTSVRSLSVKCDGTMVVAAYNNSETCCVWRYLRVTQTTVVTEFEPLHKLVGHNGDILKCVLSPQNKYLATASADKTVNIWNADGFKLEKVLRGHESEILDCDFSDDGNFLLTASSDKTARLWSIEAAKDVMVYKGHQKATVCCAFRG